MEMIVAMVSVMVLLSMSTLQHNFKLKCIFEIGWWLSVQSLVQNIVLQMLPVPSLITLTFLKFSLLLVRVQNWHNQNAQLC